MKKIHFFIWSAAILAAACAGTPTRTYTPEQPSAATMEISQGIEQFRRADAYLLQPGDLLEIKVFMENAQRFRLFFCISKLFFRFLN